MSTPYQRPPDLELTIHRHPRWRLKPAVWLAVAVATIAILVPAALWYRKLAMHYLTVSRLESRGVHVEWDERSDGHDKQGFTSVTFGGSSSEAQSRATDADLAKLPALENLESLDVSRCPQLTPAALSVIAQLKNLRDLTLTNGTDDAPVVTDAVLANVQGLTHLQSLAIPGSNITDAGIPSLAGLTRLQQLDLEGTAVTDAVIPFLKSHLPELRTVVLVGTRVSAGGVSSLRAARPALAIFHESLEEEMKPVEDSANEP